MSEADIHVLHVDDDSSVADVTTAFLEQKDDRFSTETAIRASEGLDQLSEGEFDCIISDYDMPGQNGIEFLRAVRERYPDLPFILYTGKGSEAVASEAISAGVTDYLQKGTGTEQYQLLANRVHNAVRARREAQRADRQEQLMRLTEFAGDTGGFEFDVDSGESLLTEGSRRLVGLPDDTHVTLEDAIELFHPDDRADVRQTVTQATETGEEVHGSWRLQTLNGHERLVNVTIVPATESESGDVTTLRGAIHDITDRRDRQQELEQIETLFEHAQDSLFLINVAEDFTVERVNPAYEIATGLSTDRLQGRTPREILGEHQGAIVERRYNDCVERREPLEYTEQLRFDGNLTEWETRIAPVVIDDSVEYIAGATRDVTDREERERELSRLQQAIDNASVSVTLADPTQEDDPLVYVNDAFAELTGYAPEEALGRNCRFLQGEDTDPKKVAVLREAIDNEESISVELRNYRKDGTEFWNQLTVTPIYDDDGEIVRYLGTQQDMTERKEYEQDIERTRNLLSEMEELAGIGAWEYDPDTGTPTNTAGARRIYGVDPQSSLSLDEAFEFFHPEDREKLRASFDMCLDTGEPYEMDARITTTEGTQRWVTAYGKRVDKPGADSLVRGYIRDITEQKKRELELERYEQLVENLPVGVFRTTMAGEIIDMNDTLVDIYEAESRTQLRKAGAKKLYLDESARDNLLNRLRETGQVENELLEVETLNGNRRFVRTTLTLNEEGEIKYLEGVVQDVTDRRELEREFAQIETIAKSINDAVYVLNEHGQFSYVNDEFIELTGYSEATVLGSGPDLIKDQETMREAERQLGRVLSDDGPETVTFETTIRPKESDPVVCEDHMGVLPYEGDSFNGSVGVLRDVSERKRRERELRRERDRLDEFAGIVSHDLRNPLQVANGRLELIQRECKSDHIDDVAQALDRMDALISDLLTLAREGETVTDLDSVTLATIVEDCWANVETADATLVIDVDRTIYGDESRLKQLFENLIRNAVEHGGDDVNVTIGELDDGFYVADDGPGIPEGKRDDVFDAGYSTSEKGTGFGLNIIEQIITAHEWDIHIAESASGGARFEITEIELAGK